MPSLKELFHFDHAANLATVEAFRHLPSPPGEVLRIAGHIAGIGELWLSRAGSREPSLPAWPNIAVDALLPILTAQRDRWLSLADQHSDFSPMEYTTRSGMRAVNTFGEIAQEVMLHSAHHRGQIALLLRQAGFEPPASTDFIPTMRTMRSR